MTLMMLLLHVKNVYKHITHTDVFTYLIRLHSHSRLQPELRSFQLEDLKKPHWCAGLLHTGIF